MRGREGKIYFSRSIHIKMMGVKVLLVVGLVGAAFASIGVVPKPPSRTGSTGSVGSGGSTYGSGAQTYPLRSTASLALADEATIQHALELYSAMTTAIRDVVGKAKLTPIGSSEGLSYTESCSEHKAKRSKGADTKSGVYTIYPTGKVLDGLKQVWCDMDTDGGGWTVIQRRGYGTSRDKAESFNRVWREYKAGFGTHLGDYWLGLDPIRAMGQRCTNELMVVLTYFDDTEKTATYSNFTIGPETDNYRLHLTGFVTGKAEDTFEKKHNGMTFHTSDKDSEDKCATEMKSGWWYVSKKTKSWCAYVDLNSELKAKATDTGGMTWRYHSLLKGWQAPAIKKAEMKIRPKCT